MSSMECDRKGCDNVMCDRLSRTYGYICFDCFEELVDLGPGVSIEEFMKTPKKPLHKEAKRKAAELIADAEFPLLTY